MSDYYKILGLSKRASKAEIKKAYRNLSIKHHPDLNHNEKKQNENLSTSIELMTFLSHQENRKKYDSYGKNWQHEDTYEKAYQKQWNNIVNHNNTNDQVSLKDLEWRSLKLFKICVSCVK